MLKKEIIKNAFIDALATGAYIFLIASFFYFVLRNLNLPEPNFLNPVIMLSLLVFSAALVGMFIFGRPVMWYLDGKKKEAVQLIFYTLGIFFLFMLAVLAVLFLLR